MLLRENLVRCERFAATFFEDQLGASSGMFMISMISDETKGRRWCRYNWNQESYELMDSYTVGCSLACVISSIPGGRNAGRS